MTDPGHLATEWDHLDPLDELAGELEYAAVDEDADADAEPVAAGDEPQTPIVAREPTPAGRERELVFESLEQWVEGFLLAMYRRAVSGTATTWCPEWWRHPEAVLRLESLWRAWEYLRLEPTTGMSVWLRDHCDQQMAQLLSADGPFRGCKPAGHRRALEPLPSTRPPAGWRARPDRRGLAGGEGS